MLLSKIIILSGPITYILMWVIYFIVVWFFNPSDKLKYALLVYAIAPVGAIFNTFFGGIIWLLGG